MNVDKTVAGVVGAAGLIAILAACSSTGDTQSSDTRTVSTGTSTTPAAVAAASSKPAITAPIAAKHTSPAATPVHSSKPAAVPSVIGFASTPKAAATTAHSVPSLPTLTGPVTFAAASFPEPFNCAQSGTSYYTAPNVAVALDVTVYVTSAQLAQDLTVAAPNQAPRGLSNASQYVSSSSLGHGVWRATYRTFVSLYEPKYVPVSVTSLQASAAGSKYTITFASPVSVTLSNCHS